MKNINFTVPYSIGTYLTQNVDGVEHLDQLNRYVIDEKGISVFLMLDVESASRLSTAISIEKLLQNWKEDNSMHLSGDSDTKLDIGMHFEDGPIINNGSTKILNRKG